METKLKQITVFCIGIVVTITLGVWLSIQSTNVMIEERTSLQQDKIMITDEKPDTIGSSSTITYKPLPSYSFPPVNIRECIPDKNNIPRCSVDKFVRAGDIEFQASFLELEIHEQINIERKKHGLESLLYDDVLAVVAQKHSEDMAERDYFAHMSPEGLEAYDRGLMFGYLDCGNTNTIQYAKEYEKLTQEYDLLLLQYEAGGSRDEAMYYKLDQMYNVLESKRIELSRMLLEKPAFKGIAENIFQIYLYHTAWYDGNEIISYDWNTPEQIAKITVDGWMKSPSHRENVLEPSFETQGIGVATTSDYKVYITQNFC